MSVIEGTWPSSTDKFWVIKDGSNIRVKSEENTGITRSVTLDPSDYPDLTNSLRIFQRGSDLEFVPQACIDIDGNAYDAIKISGTYNNISFTQLWTIRNLEATHNREGELIPEASADSGREGAALRYTPPLDWEPEYGCIYNWYAATGTSTIASVIPEGWDLPSSTDFLKLRSFLRNNGYLSFSSDGTNADYDIKAQCSKRGWNPSDVDNTPGNEPELNNSTGLNFYPTGYYVGGSIIGQGTGVRFWITSGGVGNNNGAGWFGYLGDQSDYPMQAVYYDNTGSAPNQLKTYGATIRCVKNLQ